MREGINAKIQASRKELLDIGLRNNLISFKKTSKTLAVQADSLSALFDALYVDGRALSFDAARDAKRKPESPLDGETLASDLADDALLEVLSARELDAPSRSRVYERAPGLKLKTQLDPERLFLQLLKMRAEAQGYVDEQGVNILFLAFGFLHWYESPQSTEARRAPLLLVPVSLSRDGAQEAFKLAYTGEDIFLNLSLQAKLKADFAITLPSFDLEGDVDSQALMDYGREVEKAVANQPRWRVAADELVLGFFSFGKFLMFRDLDPQTWPEGKGPAEHPVVARLLGGGFGDRPPHFSDNQRIDEIIAPGDVHFVRDADSSQTQAILEVRAGSHLIIQGPPGTGKSQTITNLIADLIGQDKTVLFVSEKMAALEVVKRRLDESHLGDAVLELHSQRATKTSVLSELARTMGQGQPLNDTGDRDIEELRRLQSQLNAYCEVVSAPVGASQIPFGTVLGRHLQIKRQHPSASVGSFAPMATWSERDHLLRRELVSELQTHVASNGRPDRNVFWGSSREFFTPIEEAEARQALESAEDSLDRLKAAATSLCERLMLPRPASLHDIDVICRAARRAAGAPRLQGIQLTTQDWQLRRDALKELIGAGRRMAVCRGQHEASLMEQAWEHDMLAIRQALVTYGPKWWRFLSSAYKQARGQLQALSKVTLPKDHLDTLWLVDAVMDYQATRKVFERHEGLGEALFGAQWQWQKSDWDVLERITEWVIQLHDDMTTWGVATFLTASWRSFPAMVMPAGLATRPV